MSGSPAPIESKGAKRRAGSCMPCRESKSKCSGGIPCTTCQKKRQKPRCYYMGSSSRDSENEDSARIIPAELGGTEPLNTTTEQETFMVNEEDTVELSDLVGRPHEDFYGTLSLARSVDEFKRLLPTDGVFQDIIDSVLPTQIFDLASWRGHNPSTFQSVALEQARPDLGFQPSIPLQRLYAKYYSVREQLAVGQATQAWSAFASLFRDAELFGLKTFASSPVTGDDTDDPQACRHLWWLLVELDTQLSFLLGRRPSMDPSHNVPRPDLPESTAQEDNNARDVLDFTEYMIEFLNHVHQDSNDRYSHWEDRTTMLQSELNRLIAIQSSLQDLPLTTPPDATESSRAQHRVDVHLVLMVLYCQILRSTSSENTRSGRIRNARKSAAKTQYRELLKSLRAALDIFDYSFKLDPSQAALSWPRCFGILCAASMLGIARLRQDVDVDTDSERIQRALDTFVDLANAGQVPAVAQLAVETLPEVLDGIKALEQQSSGSKGAVPMPREGMTAHENALPPSVPRASKSAQKIKSEAPSLKRRDTSNLEENTRVGKRTRHDIEPRVYENHFRDPTWPDLAYSQAMSAENATTAPKQEPSASQTFVEQPSSLSAATSFNEQMEYYEAGYVPTHPDSFVEYHPDSQWVHPPQVYFPPLYDDWLQSQFQSHENITPDGNPQQGFFDPALGLSHQLDTSMHHQAYLQRQQMSPTNNQGMMMSAAGRLPTATTTIVGHPPSDFQPTQISRSRVRQQGKPEQVLSSPGDGKPQMEGVPDAAQDRRRSLADIRQQQMETWGAQVPPNYHAHSVSVDAQHSEPRHIRRSPQQPIAFDLQAHVPYNVTMTDEGVLEYNQHLQYHQEQHHIPTTVTTGPFTGNQHWGWTE
ncbi:hypothetical protein H2200_009584 [Cladophialophora chaetospira]|uniref:Zn(2)-C6 fungal-type domain-containing protein n=1 Tax=Cladophialophora chaetospira TaxID=386627 RepID=A0AA39CEP7_9EURO|nr:hypothetical protein H2200_009584 [Cladophialophora chaetospira]